MQLAPDDHCLHCGEQDWLAHALSTCTYSSAYWSNYVASLTSSFGDPFTPDCLAVGKLITGLPTLSAVSPSSAKPLLRAIAAIGILTLLNAQLARLRPQEPTATSPAPAALAARAIIALSHRLA